MYTHPKYSSRWDYCHLLGLDIVILSLVWAWVLCLSHAVSAIPSSSFLLLALGGWSVQIFSRQKFSKSKNLSPQSAETYNFINRHKKSFSWGLCTSITCCLYLAFFQLPVVSFYYLIVPLLLTGTYLLLYKPLLSFQILPLRRIMLHVSAAFGISHSICLPLGISCLNSPSWMFSIPNYFLIGLLFFVFTWHDSWVSENFAPSAPKSRLSLDIFWGSVFFCYLLAAVIFLSDDANTEPWFFYSILSSSVLLIGFSFLHRKFSLSTAKSLSLTFLWAPLLVVIPLIL